MTVVIAMHDVYDGNDVAAAMLITTIANNVVCIDSANIVVRKDFAYKWLVTFFSYNWLV